MQYLDKYLNDTIIRSSLNQFYEISQTKQTSSSSNDFIQILESNTDKDLDWFFNDYVQTNKKIDYTIDKIEKTKILLKLPLKILEISLHPLLYLRNK